MPHNKRQKEYMVIQATEIYHLVIREIRGGEEVE